MVVVTINILVNQVQSREAHHPVEKLVLLLQEEQEDYVEESPLEHKRTIDECVYCYFFVNVYFTCSDFNNDKNYF